MSLDLSIVQLPDFAVEEISFVQPCCDLVELEGTLQALSGEFPIRGDDLRPSPSMLAEALRMTPEQETMDIFVPEKWP